MPKLLDSRFQWKDHEFILELLKCFWSAWEKDNAKQENFRAVEKQ